MNLRDHRKYYPALRVCISSVPLFVATEDPVLILLLTALVTGGWLSYELILAVLGRFMDQFLRTFLGIFLLATVAQMAVVLSGCCFAMSDIKAESLMPLVFLSGYLLVAGRAAGSISFGEQVRSTVYFWGLLSTISLTRYFMGWETVFAAPFLITALLLPAFFGLRKKGLL